MDTTSPGLVTKKGIALTVAIIGGFTAASFLVYLVPTSQPPTEVVVGYTNPAARLDFAKERADAILEEFDANFGMWEAGMLEKQEFSEHAVFAVQQVDSLILELRDSKPPEKWTQSYFLYIQALESYKAYFEQTGEYVEYASSGDTDAGRTEQLQGSIAGSLAKAADLVNQSEEARP